MSSHLRQRTLLILILTFLAGFLLIAVARGNFATVDLDVNTWAASINTGSFTPAAESISIAFDATALTAVSVAIAVALLIKKRGKYGVLLLAAMAGDLLLVQTCKELVASQRPPNMIFAQTGYSFPSGHVTGNLVFFGVLTYFAWSHWHSTKAKITIGGFYIAVTAVVGFDRIYLNVHWFSDIVGSVLLGAFWLLLCILMFQQFALKKNPKRKQKN
jgi:membrane-associated phospholipid phosphatase